MDYTTGLGTGIGSIGSPKYRKQKPLSPLVPDSLVSQEVCHFHCRRRGVQTHPSKVRFRLRQPFSLRSHSSGGPRRLFRDAIDPPHGASASLGQDPAHLANPRPGLAIMGALIVARAGPLSPGVQPSRSCGSDAWATSVPQTTPQASEPLNTGRKGSAVTVLMVC